MANVSDCLPKSVLALRNYSSRQFLSDLIAGITVGLVLNSFVFAAAHSHLPSALPLFVLPSCFTLAYEWSGSILVSMGMHALFNSIQLIFLAFPELVQQ